MADEYTVEDPDLVDTKTVGKSGQVWVGSEFKCDEVKIVIKRQ